MSAAWRAVWTGLAVLLASGVATANDVLAGHDLYVTPPGGAVQDFGDVSPTTPGDVPPLPADFFFPGSLPFTGVVDFVSVPRVTFLGQPTGPADTIVERQSDAALPGIPSQDTIPIEMVALGLRSVGPITIDPGGGIWAVAMELSTAVPSPGTMTVRHEAPEGGSWDAQIDVCPRLTFLEINAPFRMASQDYCLEVDPAGQPFQASGHSWAHEAELPLVSSLSGPDFFPAGRVFTPGAFRQLDPIERAESPPVPALGPLGLGVVALLLLGAVAPRA